jgi:hypothetical protein
LKKAYIKAAGMKVKLVDGVDPVPDDTKIRDLTHFKSDLAVFWSVIDDGWTPLSEVRAGKQNQVRIEAETSSRKRPRDVSSSPDEVGLYGRVSPRKRMRDLSPVEKTSSWSKASECRTKTATKPGYTKPLTLIAVSQALEKLQHQHPDLVFKVVLGAQGSPTVKCSDCPLFQHLVFAHHHLAHLVSSIEKHLESQSHRDRQQKRLGLILELEGQLEERYPGSNIRVSSQFGAPGPRISCSQCPGWEHKMVRGESASTAMCFMKNHLRSSGHRHPVNPGIPVVKLEAGT